MGRRFPGTTVLPARGLVRIARLPEAERFVLDSGIPLQSTYYGNVVVKGFRKFRFSL